MSPVYLLGEKSVWEISVIFFCMIFATTKQHIPKNVFQKKKKIEGEKKIGVLWGGGKLLEQQKKNDIFSRSHEVPIKQILTQTIQARKKKIGHELTHPHLQQICGAQKEGAFILKRIHTDHLLSFLTSSAQWKTASLCV